MTRQLCMFVRDLYDGIRGQLKTEWADIVRRMLQLYYMFIAKYRALTLDD